MLNDNKALEGKLTVSSIRQEIQGNHQSYKDYSNLFPQIETRHVKRFFDAQYRKNNDANCKLVFSAARALMKWHENVRRENKTLDQLIVDAENRRDVLSDLHKRLEVFHCFVAKLPELVLRDENVWRNSTHHPISNIINYSLSNHGDKDEENNSNGGASSAHVSGIPVKSDSAEFLRTARSPFSANVAQSVLLEGCRQGDKAGHHNSPFFSLMDAPNRSLTSSGSSSSSFISSSDNNSTSNSTANSSSTEINSSFIASSGYDTSSSSRTYASSNNNDVRNSLNFSTITTSSPTNLSSNVSNTMNLPSDSTASRVNTRNMALRAQRGFTTTIATDSTASTALTGSLSGRDQSGTSSVGAVRRNRRAARRFLARATPPGI